MIQTIELYPGITLRCFPDTRFKQGCMSLQLLRPMTESEAALNALLPAVLLRGCEGTADMRAITWKLDDLYGAALGTLVRRVGDYQTVGLSCGFMEDRFAMEGDRILAPMVEFFGTILRKPVLEAGAFRQEFVESEKKNLISAIESQLNNKRAYAADRLRKLMCAGDSYGISRLGTPEQVAAITPQALYAHYEKILRESPVHIFYVGAADPEQVADLLKPIFADLPHDRIPLQPQTALSAPPQGDSRETMDVAQGKLCMGFSTPITLRDREFAAMQVFNTVYGGGMISKLFMQVREKLSLCYDIGSGYYGSKGILTVSAGIDCKDEQLVREQVLAQLEDCKNGHISSQELTAAKESLISQLRSTHDSPGAIENYYATAALSGLGLSCSDYIDAVAAVTTEEVAAAAGSLQLHTTFFLEGTGHGA